MLPIFEEYRGSSTRFTHMRMFAGLVGRHGLDGAVRIGAEREGRKRLVDGLKDGCGRTRVSTTLLDICEIRFRLNAENGVANIVGRDVQAMFLSVSVLHDHLNLSA